jgi:hypothetical protein
LCGFPSDSAKISAATISAADSSEMVKSGWCFLACKGALQQLEGSQHGQAYTRKRKDYRRVIINHERQKAGSSPAPFCCSIPGGASPERVRNLARLLEGFGFTAPSRLRKPVSPPIHHLPCREIHGDDLGHVVFLKSVPVPVRPRLVTL